MVVVGLIVLVIGIGFGSASQVGFFKHQSASNRIAATLRFAYAKSVSEGLYVRMRINLSEHTYWLEGTGNPVLLDQNRGDIDLEPQDSDESREARRKQAQSGFVELTKPVKLDEGIGFDGVRLGGFEDEFSDGKVDIHFFPNGFAEPAMIFTTDGDEEYITLTLNPMTGVVRSELERLDPDRDFGRADDFEEEGR